MHEKESLIDGKPYLAQCPICGKPVEVHGGIEEWKPTFYDPDSGGDPYYVDCTCGLHFSIGHCEIEEFAKAWNHRNVSVSCDYCVHLGKDINICIGCNNRSHFKK